MKKKNILFTFDYELFLGKKSGGIEDCVITPTQKLLDILSLYKASAIFFVDTTWLIRLSEISATHANAKADYEKVTSQLQHIAKSGHYIFPHLHPHWLDAQYMPDINQWQLTNYAKYRFHNINAAEREQLFDGSVAILKEILEPVLPNYTPIGYRAGGWSIQPFEDFAPFFQKHGILYDFSVRPKQKYISSGRYYDFSDITATLPYSFSANVTLPGKGAFTEFPISTIRLSSLSILLNKLLLKYLWWNNDHASGDGIGIAAKVQESNTDNYEMVSGELLTRVNLHLYLRFMHNNNYMQFITHPKMLSRHNINTFARFMKKAYSLYNIETDFEKMLS